MTRWAIWDTYPAMKLLVGDFNGDGKADVMKLDVPPSGTSSLGLWVGLSTGTSFATSEWARWDANRDIEVLAGDFNGDGKTDVIKLDVPSSGSATLGLWVGLSDGARFATTQWDRWVTYTGMKVLAGDFNGDRKTDVMKFDVVGPPPPELEVTYLSRPEVPEPVVDAAIRGAGGTIYHGRRIAGRWTAFGPVTSMGAMASDVALVAPGPGQLDMVGVTAAGELVHVGWREGAWREAFGTSAQRPTVRYRPTKPALLATAPGQLEVVAVGSSDGRLYHLRRLNGHWQAPLPVPEAPTPARPMRDPVMVQSGNKLVLLYVDHRSRLFAAAFDMETAVWGQAFELAGRSTVAFAPAVAACGDGRVDVVHVRTSDGSVAHRQLDVQADNFLPGIGTTGISFVPETDIGGVLISAPALACSGHRRLELLGRGTDARLWHNHFSPTAGASDGRTFGPGWQGWLPASDRLIRSGLVGPRRIGGSIALAASRSGRVHLVVADYGAVSRGSAPPDSQELLHDAFDASRWGRAPWNTVQWRGLDPIPGVKVVGGPALAVSDRAVELAVVGDASRLWHAAATDGAYARFAGLGASVRYLTEPTVLSSGPGSVEVLYLGSDDTRRHLRRLNEALMAGEPIDASRGIIDFRPAAVGFGAGQIEVVAAAGDRTLYHWRHVRGEWRPPAPIPGSNGSVISVPVLLATGAGQLELLAVRGDRRLYHWRFRGGRWSSGRQLQSDVPVSAVLFGPTSASSWGDGVVDVVVAEDGTGRLFHRRIAPDEGSATGARALSAGRFVAIDAVAADVPVLTALGAARLELLVPGPGGVRRTRATRPPLATATPAIGTLGGGGVRGPALRTGRVTGPPIVAGEPPPLRWSALETVGGGLLALGGVARLGDGEVVASAVDRSGRLYLGRYGADGQWSGFWGVGGQRPDTRHVPLLRPSLTAH
jgi:hypothetical protein